MSESLCILVTQTDGNQLFKTALRSKSELFRDDSWKYWGEPEVQKQILELLPLHCRNNGKIVATEQIFECVSE